MLFRPRCETFVSQLKLRLGIHGYFCCAQIQSDKRVKKVNELIQGIRVVKLLAWEDAFVQSVEHTRKEEISYLIPQACLKGLMGMYVTMSQPHFYVLASKDWMCMFLPYSLCLSQRTIMGTFLP